MFLLYHSDRCNTSEMMFHWCYVNDLHTTHAVVCWVTTPMFFRGRRFGLTTQARRSWKIRVPMGGTLHCDRSNSRRSISTTRQENRERWKQPMECRTTLTVLCVEGLWRKENSSYGPLNPEHEATCRVLWANSAICIVCFYFPLGGSDPRVVWKKVKIIEIPYSWIFENSYKVVYNPIFDKSKHSSKQRAGKIKNIPQNTN
jgi:hypothetical protein